MKKLCIRALAVMVSLSATGLAMASHAPSFSETVDVSAGASAVMRGDNAAALKQMLAADANDPAVLINMGRVHARMGHMSDAAKAFEAAMTSRNHYDVLLSDGRIMDSRQVARLSLKHIQPSANQRVAGR